MSLEWIGLRTSNLIYGCSMTRITSQLKALSGSSSHHVQGAGAYCGGPTTDLSITTRPFSAVHSIFSKAQTRAHVKCDFSDASQQFWPDVLRDTTNDPQG